MKKLLGLLLVSTLLSCSSQKDASDDSQVWKGMKGCFLLYNLKTNQFERKSGVTCEERFPACSTFKVPLAVMAFDSGALADENQVLKWDGKKRMLEAWNQDHNAKSWMANSVVWFSQVLTPKIGKKRVQSYLEAFDYGNKDISTGLTTAWLNSPSDPRGALAINAYEQVEFLKKLWTDTLPASVKALRLTREITYLETSPNGFMLHGKTGSNFYDKDRKIQLGWFISHVSKGDQEYIAVTNLSDLKPVKTDKFGGQRAKEITKSMLEKEGIW